MGSIEKDSEATFRKFSDAASKPSRMNSLDDLMSTIHPEFRGYGTTIGEKYISKENLRSFMEEQFRQGPEGFSYK